MSALTIEGKNNLVSDWQDVMTLWDDLQARQAETQTRLSDPRLSTAERERHQAMAADLSSQLHVAKQKIDAIVREGRQGRGSRTGDFVAAELGPNLVSDAAQAPDRPGAAASRR